MNIHYMQLYKLNYEKILTPYTRILTRRKRERRKKRLNIKGLSTCHHHHRMNARNVYLYITYIDIRRWYSYGGGGSIWTDPNTRALDTANVVIWLFFSAFAP